MASRLSASFSRAEVWPLALTLLVAIAPRLVWWSLDLPVGMLRDSGSYFVPGFDLATSGSFEHDLRHTPGYSFFTALVFWTFGTESLYPLLAIQHLIGILTAGLTYLLGRLFFQRATALLGGLLVGLDGALLLFEHMPMPEVVWAFGLVVSSLTVVSGIRSGRLSLLAGAGLAIGLLALVRPIGLLLLGPAAIALVLLNRWRSPLKIAVLIGICALTVLPWIIRNWVQYGSPSLIVSTRAIMHRVSADDSLFTVWAESGRPPPDEPLRKRAYEIMVEQDRKPRPDPVELVFRRELGLSEAQARDLMRQMAVAAIQANPLYYVRTTVQLGYQNLINQPLDVASLWWSYADLALPQRAAALLPKQNRARYPEAQMLVSLVDPGRMGLAVASFFVLGVLAAWRRPAERLWLVVAAMVPLGIFGTAATAGIEIRYRFGFDPVLLLGAAAGVTALFEMAVNLARQGHRAPLPARSGEVAVVRQPD